MSKSPTDASTPQISLDGFADPQDARMFGVVMALASEAESDGPANTGSSTCDHRGLRGHKRSLLSGP